MTLRRIQVSDFRCLRSTELDLDPRFTLISGPNASGKTSLLEAIYVLGRGRSFREALPSGGFSEVQGRRALRSLSSDKGGLPITQIGTQ